MNVNAPEVFKEIAAAVSVAKLAYLQTIDPLITGVHFEYGHYTDIRERLKAKGQTSKQSRYPLICLFEDYRVRKGVPGVTGTADLKLIILHTSSDKVTREQREQKVFTPILRPLYEELIKQIARHKSVMAYSAMSIKHDMIERPHWGDPGLYSNDSYLFGDILDGIELNNLQLQLFLKSCESSGKKRLQVA